MALSDITDRDAVLQAAREFDTLGRETFLAHYGFGKAREYFLVLNGKRYDSKSIVGAAHAARLPSRLWWKKNSYVASGRTALVFHRPRIRRQANHNHLKTCHPARP